MQLLYCSTLIIDEISMIDLKLLIDKQLQKVKETSLI